MKLALLGDIHGNADALRAVLSAVDSSGAEQLLVTGDFVGYYFEPLKVMELLTLWPRYAVRGNHEDMLAMSRRDAGFLAKVDARYGTGLRRAIEQLSEEQIEELCDLPHPLNLEIGGRRILLSHGAPWNNERYVYPDDDRDQLMQCVGTEFDLVVLGHTHYPMLHQVGKTLLVNPGSVGQPRNGKSGAQWVLYDTESGETVFFCESYDYSGLLKESRRRHPELPYLADILARA